MASGPTTLSDKYEGLWRRREDSNFLSYERNELLAEFTAAWNGAGRTFLDVGCGDGVICDFFARKGFETTGIDISPTAVDRARRRFPGRFEVANAEERLPFADGAFHVVFWGDNVEHLVSPKSALAELRRVMAPGGTLLLSCPNMGYWRFRLYYLIHGLPPQTEGMAHEPWDWQHIRFFTPTVLTRFLQAGGCAVRRVAGIHPKWPWKALSRLSPTWFSWVLLAEAARDGR
ncbi:MAG: methyltransferase domain-containing protein [Planctomycetes bacterium]|nr:methyltransferase domain-containing protein [Planctomycetota bacterium]